MSEAHVKAISATIRFSTVRWCHPISGCIEKLAAQYRVSFQSRRRPTVLVHRGILVQRTLFASTPFLCQSYCPFRLSRPTTTPTAAAKRELSLANPVGQLDPCNRDGCVREG